MFQLMIQGAQVDVFDLVMQGIELAITGIIVVFTGLLLLIGVMSVFQWMGRRQLAAEKREKAAEEAAAAKAAAEAPAGPSPELLVVLTAAVHAALGRPIRITRVRYRTNPGEMGWSMQGRVSIMAGHQIRRAPQALLDRTIQRPLEPTMQPSQGTALERTIDRPVDQE